MAGVEGHDSPTKVKRREPPRRYRSSAEIWPVAPETMILVALGLLILLHFACIPHYVLAMIHHIFLVVLKNDGIPTMIQFYTSVVTRDTVQRPKTGTISTTAAGTVKKAKRKSVYHQERVNGGHSNGVGSELERKGVCTVRVNR